MTCQRKSHYVLASFACFLKLVILHTLGNRFNPNLKYRNKALCSEFCQFALVAWYFCYVDLKSINFLLLYRNIEKKNQQQQKIALQVPLLEPGSIITELSVLTRRPTRLASGWNFIENKFVSVKRWCFLSKLKSR